MDQEISRSDHHLIDLSAIVLIESDKSGDRAVTAIAVAEVLNENVKFSMHYLLLSDTV